MIDITEVDEQRFYNGLPSVTTIVGLLREPYLERWRGKVGNEEADRIKKEAGWLGTLVHDTISSLDLSQPSNVDISTLDPLTSHCVKLYLEWANNTLDHWTMIEEPLVSTRLGFGGTPDRVGVLKGDKGLTLVDFKTGHRSRLHQFQTAGYRILLAETGIYIDRRLVLYLPTTIEKGQTLSIKEHHDHIRDEVGFMRLLDVYNILQTMK